MTDRIYDQEEKKHKKVFGATLLLTVMKVLSNFLNILLNGDLLDFHRLCWKRMAAHDMHFLCFRFHCLAPGGSVCGQTASHQVILTSELFSDGSVSLLVWSSPKSEGLSHLSDEAQCPWTKPECED